MSIESGNVTMLLDQVRRGSAEATNELITSLYDRFRQRALQRLHRERAGCSLAASDVVNEALLRLLKNNELAKARSRHEVFRAFARAVRQLLIDHARKRNAIVHGGGRQREELDECLDEVRSVSRIELLALDEALRALAARHPRTAAVLEMQFFGGHEPAEIAEVLNVSPSTVARDFRFGRAWIADFLSPPDSSK